MRLTGTVIGAGVHYISNIKIVGSNDMPERKFVGLGIQHKATQELIAYDRANNPSGTNEETFVPRWLEELARASNGMDMTLILLEFPPFDPAMLEDDLLQQTVNVSADAVLGTAIRRLQPYFRQNGQARQNGWVLDGIDLRYQYRFEQGRLQMVNKELRKSLHKDVNLNGLAPWDMSLQRLRNFYRYLTGMSDDRGHLDTFATDYCAAAGNVNNAVKREIFAQAAANCRTVYGSMDEGVKYAVVEHFVAEAKALKETATTDLATNQQDPTYTDLMGATPEEDFNTAMLCYAVAQHITNVGLLGYILSPEANLRNVVVVIGQDHIMSIRRFFKDFKAIVSATVWPKEADLAEKVTTVNGSFRTTVDTNINLT
ncbi:hypothetical protein P2318_22370 [Myxococcaceae bacterium GXIMD 01537]